MQMLEACAKRHLYAQQQHRLGGAGIWQKMPQAGEGSLTAGAVHTAGKKIRHPA
jgi:hypothetical protein